MASQSLYRKWRSQTFSDLIGQEAVTRTLLNAVRDGRLAHAYLFCGPRGTGKTSAARLLAKAVNCANPHNGEPCNECLSCREITAGHSPDVIEIDAASNTGVDNIRDIRDNVGLMSSGGHYRVFTIDEVHMLTTQAFNALLKTLEEPPPHVIFVLATTEAHKVLPTVVSRCQRFDFRRFTMRDIVARLHHVAQGEGLTLDPVAAEVLARAAQGGMRDALSLLDQAVAFCGDQITYAGVRGMMGLADAAALRTLIGYVAARRAAEGLDLINDLVASGADLRQLNSQLIEEWRALMLARAGADVARLMDRTEDDAREIAALATQFTLDQLMACARVFTRNEGPARGLPIPQLALELVFLECVSLCDPTRPVAIVEATLAPRVGPAALPAPSAATAGHATPPAAYTPSAPAPAQVAYTPPAYTPATPGGAPAAAQSSHAQPSRPTPPPVTTLDLASIDRGEAPPPSMAPATAQASAQASVTPTPAAANGADGVADDEWGDTSDYDDPAEWEDVVSDAPMVAPASPPVAPARPQASGVDWLAADPQRWSLIKKICKQSPGEGSVVGALLNDVFSITVDSVQPGEPLTLVMIARHGFHAQSLREPAKHAIIEWALEQALEAPARVRVVQEGAALGPGVTVGRGPTSSTPSNSPNSPNSSAPLAPISSAASSAPRAPQPQARIEGAVREGRTGYAPGANGQNGHGGQNAQNGHARNDAGRPAQPPPSQRALEEQARADPVVQELARLLGAEVAEVRSLDAPNDEPGALG